MTQESKVHEQHSSGVISFARQKVYDPVQRLLHWWIALGTVLLGITGLVANAMEPGAERSYLWSFHIAIGQVFVAGVVLRLLWGLVGPHHARWRSFWQMQSWVKIVKQPFAIPSADGPWGHHSHAALSYLGFYVLACTMAATGVLLASILHGTGPLGERLLDQFAWESVFRFIHEYGIWAVVGFVATHIGAIIFHERMDKIPIAQSMVSGFQYRSRREPSTHAEKSVKN